MHTEFRPHSSEVPSSWPEHLLRLAAQWRGATDGRQRERLRERIWVLVVGALAMNVRRQAAQRAKADPEWAYDVSVKKALEILGAFARGDWKPGDYAPAQLQKYFALLARNAVIDTLRSGSQRQREREVGDAPLAAVPTPTPGAEQQVTHLRLAESVAACAAGLTRRARLVWFLRVFCDLPTVRIACHPAVRMQPGAVDMSLTRSRRAVQDCLEKRGFEPADVGSGAFIACWEVFREDSRLMRESFEGEERE